MLSGVEKLLGAGVRLIDHLLSVSYGIEEFCDAPGCILRIQLSKATHSVNLGGDLIRKGEPVLAVHAWNKRMPQITAGGADLEWALKFRRQVAFSFNEVGKEMRRNPKYQRVRAVYGESALFSFSEHTGGTRVMQHLGFTVLPYHRPAGKFGEFWENLFSWWLLWTYNNTSMRSREFLRLERTEIWMLADEYLRRYGEND